MSLRTIILAVAACAGLAACGDTVGQQALGGGAVGGAVAGVTGNDPLTGAAIGAVGNVAYCQTYPQRC